MKKQKIYILTTLLLYGSALFGFSEKTTTELTNAVKTEYLKEYPSIIVSNVIITDMSKEQPDDSRLVGMELQRQSLTKSSSTLIAILENGQKKTKRVFVRYEVEALLPMPKAKYNIQKDKIIAEDDVEYENVKLRYLTAKPLGKEELGNVIAKRFLPAGTYITTREAARESLVRKNSTLTAVMIDGGLEIDIEVTALEDGNENQTINVRTKNGKTVKAVVKSKNRVEIR